MSNRTIAIALATLTAALIVFIWCVEWKDRGRSTIPVPTFKNEKQVQVKAKPVMKKVHKAKKHKHTSRSHVQGFTAPSTGGNRRIGKALAAEHGWTGRQWDCLNNLWTKESGWSTSSSNSSGTAWGIPQALPGSKMRSAGKDWRTNPATQIKWGIGYIDNRYGSACKAWAHWQSHNWY